MAINDELTRIKNAKEAIKTSIEAKGVTVGSGTIDTYASKINEIPSGVDINEYFSDTITSGTSDTPGWKKTFLKFRSPLTISGTNAAYMFKDYIFSELPQIDTSNVTDMHAMFSYCKSLTTIPQLNTSNVTDMSYMFDASNITSIPLLDTSNVTNMGWMFGACYSLTSIPLLDTSNVTNMNHMVYSCNKLTEIPQFNTSNVTNMGNMFYYTQGITTIPQFNTSNVTDMSYMFYGCYKLISIPQLDASKVTNIYDILDNCPELTTVGGLKDLGKAYSTTQSANYYPYRLTFSSTTKLTEQSLINVLNNLYDIASLGVQTQTVQLGSTNLAKLTSEEGQTALTNAQTKGWTVS